MAGTGDTGGAAGGAGAESPRGVLASIRARSPWLPGAAATLVVLVVSLLVWGPGMEFPTTISQSEVPTAGTRTLTLDRTVREVTGDVIDDGVDWLTEEGDWLFDSLSDGVVHALLPSGAQSVFLPVDPSVFLYTWQSFTTTRT